MKAKNRTGILLLAAIFLSCLQMETAEDVLQRHRKALGGRTDIDKIETMVVKVNYDYPETRSGFDAVFYWKRPNLSRAEFIREPKQVIAFDGKKAWTASLDPKTGTVMNSTELPDSSPYAVNFKRNPGFEEMIGGPPLHYRSLGISAVLVGVETVDGVAAQKISLTWPDGFEKKYSFRVGDGLLIHEEVKDQKGLTHTSSLSDHREIGGLFLPCLRVNKGPLINDKRIVVHQKVMELKTNVPLPDALFIRPEKKGS